MNPQKFIYFVANTIVLLSLISSLSVSYSQSQENQDPFLKNPSKPNPNPQPQKSSTKSSPPNKQHSTDPSIYSCILEIYSIRQEKALELFEQSSSENEIYKNVLKLEQNKVATLEHFIAYKTSLEKATTIRALDEFKYPTEFAHATPNIPIAIPKDFESRTIGLFIKSSLTKTSSATIILNYRLNPVKLAKLQNFVSIPESNHKLPIFLSKSLAGNKPLTLSQGDTYFLGTLNLYRDNGIVPETATPHLSLVFFKIKKRTVSTLSPKTSKPFSQSFYTFYSLPQRTALSLVSNKKNDMDLYQAIKELTLQKKAKLEYLSTPKSHSNLEYNYPTSYNYFDSEANPYLTLQETVKDPSKKLKLHHANSKKFFSITLDDFEARSSGYSITENFDPTKNLLECSLYFEKAHFTTPRKNNLPDIFNQHPTHETVTLETTFKLPESSFPSPIFIGTFNPPRRTGVINRTDENQAWLAFVQFIQKNQE